MINIVLSRILGEKRIKMSTLAEMSGVNKNTILSLYHNRTKRVDLEVLEKVAKAIECSPMDLLEYIPD